MILYRVNRVSPTGFTSAAYSFMKNQNETNALRENPEGMFMLWIVYALSYQPSTACLAAM